MACLFGLKINLEICHQTADHRRTRLPPPPRGGGCPESPTGNPVVELKDSGSYNKALRNGLVERPSQTRLRSEIMKLTGPEVSVPMSNSSPQRIRLHSRSKDRTHTSNGQTWTMTSDSELPSDISVETASHSGCWLMPITVEGVSTLVLLDTGATVSMMGRPLYQKMQQVSWLRLQMQETLRLKEVGGNPVPALGHTTVGVGIGDSVYKATVVVSARKERPNFIIGADFLAVHNCDLSLRQKLFTIGEQKIQCIPENIRANSAKLKVARHIQLPPQTKVLVSCKAIPGIKYFGTPHAVAQPTDNSWRYA